MKRMPAFKDDVKVGQRFVARTGEYEVVELLPRSMVRVRFVGNGYECVVQKSNVKKGIVRNLYAPVVYGVGFQGEGHYIQHGHKANEYWLKMLQRAYCPEYKQAHPTYEAVEVCDEWHNYQNFAEWVTAQPGFGRKRLNLDKDLLVRGNKVYSPETCCLVPQELNKLVHTKSASNTPTGVSTRPDLNGKYIARLSKHGSGQGEEYLGLFGTQELAFAAYKVAKEAYIKERAEFWRDSIDPRVYRALMDYEVQDGLDKQLRMQQNPASF